MWLWEGHLSSRSFMNTQNITAVVGKQWKKQAVLGNNESQRVERFLTGGSLSPGRNYCPPPIALPQSERSQVAREAREHVNLFQYGKSSKGKSQPFFHYCRQTLSLHCNTRAVWPFASDQSWNHSSLLRFCYIIINKATL